MQSCDDAALLAGYQEGRRRWPGVSLSARRFATHLRELGVTARQLAAHGADLFLASACAERDPAALASFERAFISQVDLFVARTGVPAALMDEVRQKVRVKLLTGPSPSIGRYRGLGALGGWVRVTAVNVALDIGGQAAGPERPDQDLALCMVARDSSPEVEAMRSMYRDRLRGAVEESLAALGARDKTLLRLHFIDGLNIEAIGTIYRVHRATVARWLVALRQQVFKDICQRLAVKVGAPMSEMRSLVRFLGDDIPVSALRLLGASAG